MDTYLDPKINLDMLNDRLLYYPFSGYDLRIPVSMFCDFISEFWFVDTGYFRQRNNEPAERIKFDNISELRMLSESFTGPDEAELEDCSPFRKYRYLEPGYLERLFLYKGRNIRVILRRGFDYTSLFGPSKLEIASNSLGIFFFRGTSSEGGSNHPWISDKKVRMLYGEKKVQLLPKLLDVLPSGGLIVTDASLGYFCDSPMKETNPYYPMHEFHDRPYISCEEAYLKARPFEDDEGRCFSCIGYAGMRNGPTLVWQVTKS